MDILKKLFFLTLVVLIAACGNTDQDSARQAPVQNQPAPATTPAAPSTPNTTATTPPPTPAEPAQNAQGIWHYTCPNGHAGGAGSATACGECGATLVHNQAYHGNTATPTATNAATPVTGGTPPTMFTDPTQAPVNATIGTAPTQVQTPEPAQNAAGVWHYSCSNGCSGGAGSAIACSQCGNTLAHNQAYHN